MRPRGHLAPRAAAALLCAVAVTAISGCGGAGELGDEARPVTTEESQLLAVARFRNFDAGARSVSFEVTDSGADLSFEGWVDYRSGTGTGYGLLLDAGEPASLLLWDEHVIGARPAASTEAPLPIPDADALATAWQGGGLDPAGSRLHAVLAVLASLGSDRPENPLLLQQGGALWLGEEEVDGVPLTVFAGPASESAAQAGQSLDPEQATVRYWLDDVGLLHRVQLRLGGGAAWTTVELGEAAEVHLDDPLGEER